MNESVLHLLRCEKKLIWIFYEYKVVKNAGQ